MAIETRLAISAFIDLLGFSNHLELASNDVRTEIGEMAINRLLNLEKVLKDMSKEEKKFKEYFPSAKIERTRFNDAIFFTMELNQTIKTEIGDISCGFSYNEAEKMIGAEISKENRSTKILSAIKSQSDNVAKFLAHVARIHNKINETESKNNFPGARTVVSTGYKVIDKTKKLDSFSANFSVSNAFIVGESGSKSGFGGNKFYVENNVAKIISFADVYHSILYRSTIVHDNSTNDPYEIDFDSIPRYLPNNKSEFKISEKKQIRIFGKDYNFRELNPSQLSWILILKEIQEDHKNDSLLDAIHKKLSSTPIPFDKIEKFELVDMIMLNGSFGFGDLSLFNKI